MEKPSVLIFGCGFQGKIVFEIVQALPWNFEAFVDDSYFQSYYRGFPVFTRNSLPLSDPKGVIVAIGNDNAEKITQRQAIIADFKARGFQFPTIIAPSATVSKSAFFGEGCIVHPAAVIMADTRIDDFCIISTSASLDHDNHLEKFVNICPGVITAGNVRINSGAFIGTGAIILPDITIGARAVVGAGAVVTQDVPEFATVVGNPARRIR